MTAGGGGGVVRTPVAKPAAMPSASATRPAAIARRTVRPAEAGRGAGGGGAGAGTSAVTGRRVVTAFGSPLRGIAGSGGGGAPAPGMAAASARTARS